MQILKGTIINAETKIPNLFTTIYPLYLLSNSNLPQQMKGSALGQPLMSRKKEKKKEIGGYWG